MTVAVQGRAYDILLPGAVALVIVTPAMSVGALAALMRQDFPLSASEIGALVGLLFLCSAAATRLGERVASRYPATLVGLWAVLTGSAVCAGVALVHTKPILFAACFVVGVVNGLIAPSLNLLIMALVPRRQQGLAFGLRVAAPPATSTLAAVTASILVAHTWSWTVYFWLMAIVGIGVAGVMWRASARDPGPVPPSPRESGRSPARTSLTLLAVGGLLAAASSTVIGPFLVVSMVDQGHSTAAATTLLAIGGWLVIVSRVGIGFMSDRLGSPSHHLRLVALMLLACGAGMAVIGFDRSFAAAAVAAVVALGFGWSWPGLYHHSVISSFPESQARATSLVQSGTYFGSVLGPFAFGLVADHASYSTAWGMSAAAALAASCFLVLGVRLVRRVARLATV